MNDLFREGVRVGDKKKSSKLFVVLLAIFVIVSSFMLFAYMSKANKVLSGMQSSPVVLSSPVGVKVDEKVVSSPLPIYQVSLVLKDPEYFLETVVLPIEPVANGLYKLELSIVPVQAQR